MPILTVFEPCSLTFTLVLVCSLQTLELNQKIELKKKDIEKLQEKEKGLHAMFVQSLGDNNKFADYLTKVFKKKIKRSKKKENAEGG